MQSTAGEILENLSSILATSLDRLCSARLASAGVVEKILDTGPFTSHGPRGRILLTLPLYVNFVPQFPHLYRGCVSLLLLKYWNLLSCERQWGHSLLTPRRSSGSIIFLRRPRESLMPILFLLCICWTMTLDAQEIFSALLLKHANS